ncbi:MAG: hypothetical protein Q8Q09_06155 [Deltaproteobacteria bacterium]|nr:hypothetical protein [Deltaproteobacteria bacterium]
MDASTALSLELIDALTVIATPGWTAVELSLALREDRPFAASLVSEGSEEGLARAAMGLDPGDVRAALDEAIAELAEQVCARPVTLARVRVERTGDEYAHVEAWDTRGVSCLVCAIDGRHLPTRVYTEALYAQGLEAAERMDAGQRALAAQAQGHDDWEYDARTTQLSLKKGVLPWRTYEAQVLGSWARESETLLWAWANEELPPTCAALARSVREGTRTEPGLGALRRPHLPADEPFAMALARIAAARTGASAVYPAVYEAGVLYLAITSAIAAQ